MSQRAIFVLSVLLSFSVYAQGIVIAAQNSRAAASLDTTHRSQKTSLDFSLTPNYLAREVISKTKLDKLPDVCLTNTECGAQITATNVTFADCGTPWTICRCEQKDGDQPEGPISLDAAIDRLARIPVGLRRYISTVLIIGGQTRNAYTLTDGRVHIFGNISMEGWLHESVHAFDFFHTKTLSSSDGWLDAVFNDTCTPDDYSLSNAVEDFAQMGVMKLFKMAHYDVLPNGWEPDCMKRQLDFMDSLPVYNRSTLFGTCDGTLDGASHQDAPAADVDVDLVMPLVENHDLSTDETSASAKPSATVTASELGDGALGLSPTSGWLHVATLWILVCSLSIL